MFRNFWNASTRLRKIYRKASTRLRKLPGSFQGIPESSGKLPDVSGHPEAFGDVRNHSGNVQRRLEAIRKPPETFETNPKGSGDVWNQFGSVRKRLEASRSVWESDTVPGDPKRESRSAKSVAYARRRSSSTGRRIHFFVEK